MTPNQKYSAAVLAALLIPTALLAGQQESAAVQSADGDQARAPEAGEWIPLLSADTKSLEEHWTTTGNWTLKDGVATLTPREGEKGWSRWTAYLWSKEKYGDFDIEFEYRLKERGN